MTCPRQWIGGLDLGWTVWGREANIWNGPGTLWPGTGGWFDMDSLETEECSVVERPGTGVQTFFRRLHLFTRNSLYIYKIWYKDCSFTCHQQNSKIQRELELRMTGGHPDSLTSVKVIDLMTTTVLASLLCLQLINCSIFLNFIEKNCL